MRAETVFDVNPDWDSDYACVPWLAAGVDGKAVGQGRRGNHRVVGAGLHLPTRATQRGGHSTEGPCSLRVKRQRVEVGLGLLKVGLTRGTFLRLWTRPAARPTAPRVSRP